MNIKEKMKVRYVGQKDEVLVDERVTVGMEGIVTNTFENISYAVEVAFNHDTPAEVREMFTLEEIEVVGEGA